jgi:hypothetical protein
MALPTVKGTGVKTLYDAGVEQGRREEREECAALLHRWEQYWLNEAKYASGLSGQVAAADLARAYRTVAGMIVKRLEPPKA